MIPPLTEGGGIKPYSLAYFFVATVAGSLTVRHARRTMSRRRDRRRVLVVGTGTRALALWKRLSEDELTYYELAGFLDTASSTPANDEIARRCIGTFDDLEKLLMYQEIDEVYVALPVKSHYLQIQEAILICERVGVRAKYQATFFDSQLAWPRYDDPGSPTVTMHVVPNDYRLAIKRTLDIIGSAVALILLLAADAGRRDRDQDDEPGPGVLRAGTLRPEPPALPDVQVPDDAHRRRGAAGVARVAQRGGRPGLQDQGRPADHADRPLPAPHVHRRAAAVRQRAARATCRWSARGRCRCAM